MTRLPDEPDTAEDDAPTNQRSPLWAALCDALVPGLGHWYLGVTRQAVVIAAAYLSAMPILVVALVAVDRHLWLVLWATVAIALLLRILAAAHAVIVAKRIERFEKSKLQTFGGYLAFIAIVASLGHVSSRTLRARALEPLRVPTASGLPNLAVGDHFIVTKLSARDRAAQRGDLITFVLPGTTEIFIKRVVAVEGETVAITDNVVTIDGRILESSACETTDGLVLSAEATCRIEHTPEGVAYPIQVIERASIDLPPTQIPPGSVFVLGDNRSASHDSRAFGPVPLDAVTGRARAIWYPLARTASLDPER